MDAPPGGVPAGARRAPCEPPADRLGSDELPPARGDYRRDRRAADRIRAAADIDGGRSEYGVNKGVNKDRAHAEVFTANPAAMVENQKYNTLLRALGGG